MQNGDQESILRGKMNGYKEGEKKQFKLQVVLKLYIHQCFTYKINVSHKSGAKTKKFQGFPHKLYIR